MKEEDKDTVTEAKREMDENEAVEAEGDILQRKGPEHNIGWPRLRLCSRSVLKGYELVWTVKVCVCVCVCVCVEGRCRRTLSGGN